MSDTLRNNREIVSEQLGAKDRLTDLTLETEEQRHPWTPGCLLPFERPLLRTWDKKSGSKPDRLTKRMAARAEQERLDTFISRKTFLQTHLDHKKWQVTPGISFTTSPSSLADLANYRMRNPLRGPQELVVINPNVRLAKGLPIINAEYEMAYYQVSSPYASNYWDDHYICLWTVTPHEVVNSWAWDDLMTRDSWYEQVVLPAFRRHSQEWRKSHLSGDMACLMTSMRDVSCESNTNNGKDPRKLIKPVTDSVGRDGVGSTSHHEGGDEVTIERPENEDNDANEEAG